MKNILCAVLVMVCLAGCAWAEEEFPLKNVKVRTIANVAEVQGEITNNSGQDYDTAMFTLNVYDKNKNLMGSTKIAIQNFEEGKTADFSAVITKSLAGWKTCSIQFDSGL